MPHFIIECSENILQLKTAHEIMDIVYDSALQSNLFADDDIKVRLKSFSYHRLGKSKTGFVHVFGNIMEGRTTEQKAHLSYNIIQALDRLLPGVSILSMNIQEFELNTYCNKALINPANTQKDRHFK